MGGGDTGRASKVPCVLNWIIESRAEWKRSLPRRLTAWTREEDARREEGRPPRPDEEGSKCKRMSRSSQGSTCTCTCTCTSSPRKLHCIPSRNPEVNKRLPLARSDIWTQRAAKSESQMIITVCCGFLQKIHRRRKKNPFRCFRRRLCAFAVSARASHRNYYK